MKEEKTINLNVDREIFYDLFSGKLKEIHRPPSEYWKKVFLFAKENGTKTLTVSNGRQKTRNVFVIELIKLSANYTQLYFSLGGIISSDINGIKTPKEKKVKQKKENLSSKEYSIKVENCIRAIIKEIKVETSTKDFKDLDKLQADQIKFSIVRKYCNQYQLNYTNINQIYYGNYKR